MNKTLYIDESGNTGSTLYKNGKFNFFEQPYYVLASILLDDNLSNFLSTFIKTLKNKYRINMYELKANKLYDSNYKFINELVDYIMDQKIPIFIELMDKKYYIATNIFETAAPSNILPFEKLPEGYFIQARDIVSNLCNYFDDSVYEFFTKMEYTNEWLEQFYQFMVDKYKNDDNMGQFCRIIEDTRKSYFEEKIKNPKEALDSYLMKPSYNSKGNPKFLLPNYQAFTDIIGRVNLFCEQNSCQLKSIVHDNQEQYNTIFEEVFNEMKIKDLRGCFPDFIEKKMNPYILKETNLSFDDSKNNISIQVADVLAGLINQWWQDFINENQDCNAKYYMHTFYNLSSNINFVVPDQHFEKMIMFKRMLTIR